MEPQVPVRHHPQVALTHRGKNRRGDDGVWGEMLELHPVVVAECPHEATWGRAQAVAVELGEGDHVSLGRLSHPKIPTLECDLENTKNKAKDFIIL